MDKENQKSDLQDDLNNNLSNPASSPIDISNQNAPDTVQSIIVPQEPGLLNQTLSPQTGKSPKPIPVQPSAQTPINTQSINTVVPVVAPQTATSAQAVYPQIPQSELQPTNSNTSSMNLVLQWITYALWGWTLLVLSIVIFNLVLSIFSVNDIGEAILYPLSALFVLLPASIIADIFYSKVEPAAKKGGAQVIMVIHAVIYILFMIGFLIAAVFSLVGMVLNSGESTDSLAYIISSLLVALCYAIITTRTLKPSLFRRGM